MKNSGSGGSNKIKTKLACILEADESTKLRMGNSVPNHHEDPFCRKRRQFITALQFGSQIYFYSSSYEKSCSKVSGGQGMGKIEKISAWNLTKVISEKEVIDETVSKVHQHHK